MKKSFAVLILFLLSLSVFAYTVHLAHATTYTYVITGPYYYNGAIAGTAGTNAIVGCVALWPSGTEQTFNLTGTGSTTTTQTITTSAPVYQLLWEASSTLNLTSIIDFQPTVTTYNVNIYIPSPLTPTYLYTFPVTDFAGMTHPYLECSISTNGATWNLLEQYDLNASANPQFVLPQFTTCELTFLCDQGAYSQMFTAGTVYTYNLVVQAGAFQSNFTSAPTASAERIINSSELTMVYTDPNSTTIWIYIAVTYLTGSTQTLYYSGNVTASFYNNTIAVSNSTDYYIQFQAYRGGTILTWDLVSSAPTGSNPFTGLLNFLGTWPAGIDPSQIIAAGIILLFLGVGSFRSAGVSCILAWIIAGVMIAIGWFTMSIPMFAFAGLLSILVFIDEQKAQAREA